MIEGGSLSKHENDLQALSPQQREGQLPVQATRQSVDCTVPNSAWLYNSTSGEWLHPTMPVPHCRTEQQQHSRRVAASDHASTKLQSNRYHDLCS